MNVEIIEALTVVGGAMGVCAWGMYACQGTVRLTGMRSIQVLRSALAVIIRYAIIWGALFGSYLLVDAAMPWLKFFGWLLLVLFFDYPMAFVWIAVGGIVLGMFWKYCKAQAVWNRKKAEQMAWELNQRDLYIRFLELTRKMGI